MHGTIVPKRETHGTVLQLGSASRAHAVDGADGLSLRHSDSRALSASTTATSSGSHEDGLGDLLGGGSRGDDDGGGELTARRGDGLVAADGDSHDALRGQHRLDSLGRLFRAHLGGRRRLAADGDDHGAGEQAGGRRSGLAAS